MKDPNDKELLLKQLAEQIKHAYSMYEAWGEEARRAACDAGNSTVAMLEALGVNPEEAMEIAEAMAWETLVKKTYLDGFDEGLEAGLNSEPAYENVD
jgi:hypothetical protein